MNLEDKIHFEIAEEGKNESDKLDQVDHLHHYSKYHHFFTKIISLFMALLMVMWIVAGFPVGGIIRGQLESNVLDDGKLKLDEITIEFDRDVLSELLSLYYLNQEHEFSVCLQGELDKNLIFNDEYKIDSMYVPEIYEQSYSHVRFESCSEETLIMLHTHPYKSCLASSTDLETLASNQLINPDMVMLVMCEPERFSVYS